MQLDPDDIPAWMRPGTFDQGTAQCVCGRFRYFNSREGWLHATTDHHDCNFDPYAEAP